MDTASVSGVQRIKAGLRDKLGAFLQIDKELIIIFLLVSITAIIFFFVSNQRAFLNFFYLPVVIGAYFFGKRYATYSAFLSIILIFLIAYFYPATFIFPSDNELFKWLDIATWGGFIIITGYLMGHLYEKKETAKQRIKKTYQGIIEMLSLMIDAVDRNTQSHSYRVSVISTMLAQQMKCLDEEIENIRVAALLHDLGKLGISTAVLQNIKKLSSDEREHMKTHAKRGVDIIEPIGGKVFDILPFILYHHEKYDGSGYYQLDHESIPLGARIIAVADVFDALISDRPYRKGLSPMQAKKEVVDNAGAQFDPAVVKAFEDIFSQIDSEIPLLPKQLQS